MGIATSKVLLENSNHELRNAPINSKTVFGNKIQEVAKGNFEAQQQRFLAPSSVASTMQQQQKVTYLAPPVFKRPKQSANLNLLGLSKRSHTGLKSDTIILIK